MTAQYANLAGRRFVNEDFVNGVRALYPATTKKIPLGYSTYVGWTGKDEVLFTQHDAVGGLEGKVYEATFSPANPAAFEIAILQQIKHTTKSASEEPVVSGGHVTESDVIAWGALLPPNTREARVGLGMYGYSKSIQAACDSAVRRLNRKATALVKNAAKRDEAVLSFLSMHAQRGSSTSAKTLLAAYQATMPKFAMVEPTTLVKNAGKAKLGMYGFPAKTAKLGLLACTMLRETAGMLAADMHSRRAALHQKITGFLGEHEKTAGCGASRLILSSYPDPTFRFRRASEPPSSVEGWLSADTDDLLTA
jgi:hypothetical protein